MKSKLAMDARRALLAASRRLTPEQRLEAFLAHNRLMLEFRRAGERLRVPMPEARRVGTRGPGEAALLLLDAVEILGAERIDYAVIGAMAASVHGLVRAGVDVGVVLSLPPSGLGRLEQRYASAGLQTAVRRGDADDPIAAMLVLTDRDDNRVDLLVGLRGLETEAFARAIAVPFQGEKLRVIGREDFVAMKVYTGGPQDIADARNALAGAAGVIDLPFARRLAARFGQAATATLEALLAEC